MKDRFPPLTVRCHVVEKKAKPHLRLAERATRETTVSTRAFGGSAGVSPKHVLRGTHKCFRTGKARETRALPFRVALWIHSPGIVSTPGRTPSTLPFRGIDAPWFSSITSHYSGSGTCGHGPARGFRGAYASRVFSAPRRVVPIVFRRRSFTQNFVSKAPRHGATSGGKLYSNEALSIIVVMNCFARNK